MRRKLRILAAGDLHGDFDVADKLSRKAGREKVDLVILAGDIYGYGEGEPGILEVFARAGQKVVFVPGNCDFDEDLERMGEGKNIHGCYVDYAGVGIAGVGCGNWKLGLDDGDLELIRGCFSRMKSERRILVSHLHAAGTLAEFSGVAGEDVLRRAIEEFGPDLLIAAHIHEGEGIEDVIGETRVVQVGRRGKIIEV